VICGPTISNRRHVSKFLFQQEAWRLWTCNLIGTSYELVGNQPAGWLAASWQQDNGKAKREMSNSHVSRWGHKLD